MSVDFSDTKTIDEIYYSKIVPELKLFEQNRLAVNRFGILGILIASASLLYVLFIAKGITNPDDSRILGWVGLAFMFVGTTIYGALQSNLNKNFKSKIYPLFLNPLGITYRVGSTGDIDFFRECFKRTGIFSSLNNITVDDIIQGVYKNLDYQLFELNVSYRKKQASSRENTVIFNGTCLIIPSNKPFASMTVVKSDMSFLNQTNINELRRVKLEDVEFEKMFEVYSNDQVEARFLLTTAFMARLVNYTKEKESSVYVIFHSGYIYLFVNYADEHVNLFEFNLAKTLYDKETFTNILQDVNGILTVVDGLKLEQDLGL